jgi:protein ImuA
MDRALGGGLPRGALHEVFACQVIDEPAAASFAVILALRAAGERPVVWVRQDFVGLEMGEIYAPGLAELGLSPQRLILVRARDAPGVLKAAEEAARCPPLGALLVEPWGNPKTLDLVASRRLALAAARSNLPLFMVRAGGTPAPSAAATRWMIGAAPSTALDAEAPGHPAFTVNLMRDRVGSAGQNWIVEWDRDSRSFKDLPAQGRQAISGRVLPVPAGEPRNAVIRQAG